LAPGLDRTDEGHQGETRDPLRPGGGSAGQREYLTGPHFTAADAYAFHDPQLDQFPGIDLQPYPKIRAYMDRIAARPAVQAAMGAEGLLKQAA
jgi:glutathione S-transferase